MKKKNLSLSYLFVLFAVLLAVDLFFDFKRESENPYSAELQRGFTTNEAFIEALYKEIDTNNTDEVFRFVFSQLDEEVDLYPGENFYYYKFIANGKTYGGAIGISTRDRDSGVLHFGYAARQDFGRKDVLKLSDDSGGGMLNVAEGVIVKKIDDFKYSINFEGKTVIFNMYQPGLKPPKQAKLLKDEIYIGPVIDESGLFFYLLFNSDVSHMYHILNEDNFVPEQFERYTENIIIGERTGFAFYDDEINNRKILIGVDASHVLNNDWYDGPFDHMPDNYIARGDVEFEKYVEASYPGTAGRIDKHSRYMDNNGTRVAIAPYIVYYEKDELQIIVDRCLSLTSDSSNFYRCITQQIYDAPRPKIPVVKRNDS